MFNIRDVYVFIRVIFVGLLFGKVLGVIKYKLYYI